LSRARSGPTPRRRLARVRQAQVDGGAARAALSRCESPRLPIRPRMPADSGVDKLQPSTSRSTAASSTAMTSCSSRPSTKTAWLQGLSSPTRLFLGAKMRNRIKATSGHARGATSAACASSSTRIGPADTAQAAAFPRARAHGLEFIACLFLFLSTPPGFDEHSATLREHIRKWFAKHKKEHPQIAGEPLVCTHAVPSPRCRPVCGLDWCRHRAAACRIGRGAGLECYQRLAHRRRRRQRHRLAVAG